MTSRSFIRNLVLLSYAMQIVMAFTGALNLWLAIDFFMRGWPTMSALFTAVSFWNGVLFLEQGTHRRALRSTLKEIQE